VCVGNAGSFHSEIFGDQTVTTINFLWIGDRLGEVSAACLRSFVRHGYRVVLHCYDRPADTPKGVELFQASKLMKPNEIVRYKKTGGLSLSGNIYRLRILREGMGTYVDADIYCLRPLPEDKYLLGFERDNHVNNAVLRMPPDSKLLADLLQASENPYFIPPWRKQRWKRVLDHSRRILGFPIHVSNRPFGTIGPRLITYLVKRDSLQGIVQPIDILYPLHFENTSLLFARGLRLADITTSRSCTIHLMNSSLDGREILPDTPLHEVISS
jgi:hypothetical protein